jgi:hypothetical protein
MTAARVLGWAALAAVAAGCGERPASPATSAQAGASEAQVREAFGRLQTAIKARDAARVWDLLDKRSREDARGASEEVRAAYDKAAPRERAKMANAFGLSEKDLAMLQGPDFLKTHTFWDKYEEFADGVVDRVSTESSAATVYFREPDGDREKLVFVLQDGGWKAWLKMPKVK